jgi:hypothetical protein
MKFSARDLNGHCGLASVDVSTQLGLGATASVHSAQLNGQRYAAKIFHGDRAFPTAKIVAMLANPPVGLSDKTGDGNVVTLAWPTQILSDDKGKDAGFLMPELDLKVTFPLDYFYDQTLFKKLKSPVEAALSFRLEIAKNLSRLIADLHEQGHCFIDMKPQNIRVTVGSHVVCLLDCDGFSIKGPRNGVQLACLSCGKKNRVPTSRLGESPICGKCGLELLSNTTGTAGCTNFGTRFPAELLSTDYISPEASRGNIPPNALGEPQDRYALAVLLFQLFNRGTHPFQGIPLDDSIEATTNDEKAARGLYPHGLLPHPSLRPRPHSIHEYFEPGLRSLFDLAFVGDPNHRPSARDWEQKIDLILRSKLIVRCDKFPNDVSHMRFRDQKCPACYLASVPSVSMSRTKSTEDHAKALPHSMPLPSPPPNESTSGAWAVPVSLSILVLFIVVLINSNNKATTQSPPVELPSLSNSLPAVPLLGTCSLETGRTSTAELCRSYWGSADTLCDVKILEELTKRRVAVQRYSCGKSIDPLKSALQTLGDANRSVQHFERKKFLADRAFVEAVAELSKTMNSAAKNDNPADETRLFRGVMIKPFSSLVLAYGDEDCNSTEEVTGVCTQVPDGLLCGYEALRGKPGMKICISSFSR